MEKFILKTQYRKMLADTFTPVGIYLRLRDKLAKAILLESSDYHGSDNSFSYICAEPMASFELKSGSLKQALPDGTQDMEQLAQPKLAIERLATFAASFQAEEMGFKFIHSGLFGYMGFGAVQYFEDIKFNLDKPGFPEVPDMLYHVYRFVIAIDHFKNELYLFENTLEGQSVSRIDEIAQIIKSKNYPEYTFNIASNEVSNFSDEEFLSAINKGKEHCFRGDVFQIVLSRRFQTQFTGDEFNVYRALRSINPSPYLFYFDFGSFKIFGSSPEAQIVIKNSKATIFPIAGTFKRTGNDEADAKIAQQLYNDPKENAEHVMLVDLARNDLSRHGTRVKVEVYKEIQYYSHLIHLVSRVSAELEATTSQVQLVADTFPAGTLSGAPKHRAMQLIDQYENVQRSYYGGAIGFLGFNGDFNHAIMIRSFLSQENTLTYQAGAGVVAKSDSQSELQEVNNKLAALRKALEIAEHISE